MKKPDEIKISSVIYSKLIYKAPRARFAEVYLLGMNKKKIITRMIKLVGVGGCWRMPSIDAESLHKSTIFLSLKGYKVCGLARVRDSFADNLYWNDYSGMAIHQINNSFILTVDVHNFIGVRKVSGNDYRQLVINITDK